MSTRHGKISVKDVDDETLIQHLLREADRWERGLETDWTAPWLLSDIHAEIWVVRTADSRLVNGVWKNTLSVLWDYKLPNNTSMSDEENSSFRRFSQQAAFLFREKSISSLESARSHILMVSLFKLLGRWVYRYARTLSPAANHFRRVDVGTLEGFLTDYANGGTFFANGLPEAFLDKIDPGITRKISKVRGSQRPITDLPFEIRSQVVTWLTTHNFYTQNGYSCYSGGLQYIDHAKVRELIGCDREVLATVSARLFFRQFEPQFLLRFPALLVSARVNTSQELPSHRTLTLEEARAVRPTQTTMISIIGMIHTLFSTRPSLPGSLPDIATSELDSLQRFVRNAPPTQHTPWIPLEIGLEYLNEALRWVEVYGAPLVMFYTRAVAHFTAEGWFHSEKGHKAARNRKLRNEWVVANLPQQLTCLGISGWSEIGSGESRDVLRDSPSLNQAMTILVAACTHVVSGLAPSRANELASIPKLCLKFRRGDGYWITKRRGKALVADTHTSNTIPVPRIVAKAVLLLTKISNNSMAQSGTHDAAEASMLFYLPIFGRADVFSMCPVDERTINRYLDRFCDYVNTQPDQYGRRWYVRIHEDRKSFLLSFVLYFKGTALDAARALAGHMDVDHILAYIKENMGGLAIPEIEGTYISRALWNFYASGKKSVEAENIDKLYKKVCKHFNVNEISEVDFNEVEQWVELNMVEKNYSLTSYSVIRDGKRARFAIRVGMKS